MDKTEENSTKATKTINQLEKVAINDALPRKAAWRDIIGKLKSFWGFESDLQTKLMPFRLHSLRSATLMPFTACVMDWRQNSILRVGKNSGPVFSRLWTKVDEILGTPCTFQRLCPIVYVMFRTEDIRH